MTKPARLHLIGLQKTVQKLMTVVETNFLNLNYWIRHVPINQTTSSFISLTEMSTNIRSKNVRIINPLLNSKLNVRADNPKYTKITRKWSVFKTVFCLQSFFHIFIMKRLFKKTYFTAIELLIPQSWCFITNDQRCKRYPYLRPDGGHYG